MKLTKNYSDIANYGEKYNFYHNESNNTVVCTTTYKGQIIRGVAKCNPDDEFTIDIGKKLAYLRCKKKFAHKKLKRAQKAERDAFLDEIKAKQRFYKASEFYTDSSIQFDEANAELIMFEKILN